MLTVLENGSMFDVQDNHMCFAKYKGIVTAIGQSCYPAISTISFFVEIKDQKEVSSCIDKYTVALFKIKKWKQ